MTLDDAKYNLNNKILEIKKILRNRKIEVEEVMRKPVIKFNDFEEPKALYSKVMYELYREVKQLIGYIYLHELDELKRKKLAMYFVMQYSFSDFKEHILYEETFAMLNSQQKSLIDDFEVMQENIRKEIIRDLKTEYFSLEEESPFDVMKIKWNGTGKQLAELFVELHQSGWITFNEGERKPICNTISKAFLINKNGKHSEIKIGSFYSTFMPDKGHKDEGADYTVCYQEIYTKHYKPSFEKISKLNV